MKKHLWIINLIFLVINILLFIYFTVYTIIGSKPFGDFITDKDIEIQLIISIIYEFVYFAISVIISKILKKDLSYKGIDVFILIPKKFIAIICILALVIIIYSVIAGISSEFIIMIAFMLFSITLQIGLIKCLRTF